ncbi:Phosphoethanolamine N-methyltransferase 1 [Fusarium odoratissimum]|uniref:Phosphoethanolamine N-methyltransferase 1 n=1 Tax=Fusarium oxysporum f. sp. cubense (strain race 4) TaxID=2502994 RepID=N1S378_FUSC4|nr:Phosphoethanolamine N-methyltransferase 1 [Fusarium odoratissimum]
MSDKASSPKKSPKSPSSGASEVVLHDAGHWAALAQDEQDEDTDSSLGVDTESSTASMTSSILNYRTIKGRTYHSERGNAEYWASNDAQQNEVMDIIHHFLVLTLDGKLHLAPLKDDIKSVLDVGTGTGIWAIDFADEHPQAEVIGTDISPIQPSWVPPNVKFEIEDCTQPWTFSPDSFDFIYMRYLYGSISDWSALFQEAFRSCKPGGWVESFEASPCLESDDDTVKDGSAMSEWGKFFIEGGKRLGRTFTILDDDLQKQGMEDAGFTDIQTRDFKLPIGSWPKDPKMQEIGNFAFAAMDQDLEGFVFRRWSATWQMAENLIQSKYGQNKPISLTSWPHYPSARLSTQRAGKSDQENAPASNRRSASIASLNEQWNGPDWLPPDIRVGIVFVNLTHPPDGVVCFLHKITDILLEQLVPLHCICIPRVVKIPGPLGLPVNDTEVSDLPAASIEVDCGARPISSPSPSTGSAQLAEIADTDDEMTNTNTSSNRNTVSPMRSIDKHNALIQDIDLTSDITTACEFDQVTSELVETAKARVISIGCIWEAKIQRAEALRVHVR